MIHLPCFAMRSKIPEQGWYQLACSSKARQTNELVREPRAAARANVGWQKPDRPPERECMRRRGSQSTRRAGWASGVGAWLHRIIRKEQRGDPQWEEESRRERVGKIGENVRTEEEAREGRR
jgi:hypothetical protein